DDQLIRGPRRGRERRRIERGERTLGLVKSPDKEKTPGLEMARMRGVYPVTVLLERRPRRLERLRRPTQVARHQCDLRLGDDAARAGHGLSGTEGAAGASQESLRPREIAELRHRDAAKRESGRVRTQANPLQRAEEVASSERERSSRDQRVHRNPDTLVTPGDKIPAPEQVKTKIPLGRPRAPRFSVEAWDFADTRRPEAMSTSVENARKPAQPAMHTPPVV